MCRVQQTYNVTFSDTMCPLTAGTSYRNILCRCDVVLSSNDESMFNPINTFSRTIKRALISYHNLTPSPSQLTQLQCDHTHNRTC